MKATKAEKAEETTQQPEDADSLPAKKELALRAVLSHPTLREAALAAGVSETTLWRYMQDEAFARRLREARREAFSHAMLRLQHAANDAVNALQDVLKNPDAGGSVRVAAARVILDQSRRAIELDDLRARVNELEQFILRKQEEDALDRGAAVGKDDEDGD